MSKRRTSVVESLKCVLVGDSGTGKSSLVTRYSTGKFPSETQLQDMHQLDCQSVNVMLEALPVNLVLWDSAADDQSDKLRPLSYENTHVFLALFDITNPRSYESVRDKWVPEVKSHCPQSVVILVGTKADLREDIVSRVTLTTSTAQFISSQQGFALAKEMQAKNYFECSALQKNGVNELFDEVMKCGLLSEDDEGREQGRACLCPCCAFV